MNIDPKKALEAIKKQNETNKAEGKRVYDLRDPEEVTAALQDRFDLSYTDADDLGLEVWELL